MDSCRRRKKVTVAQTAPLAGITVLDLSRVLAGPYCTMVLADLGARVIKIENPDGGDDSRAYGPFVNGVSAYFMSVNRGKESIALDLKSDADRAIFEKMIPQADVLVENFRPGTMERLGYGWRDLHRKHPALIYAATSGFGHTGPYSNRAAYDMVVQAMGGIMSLTGQPGSPPTRVGTSIGDIVAALFTVIGIVAALHERKTSGAGRMIDVSMLDCQVAILENAVARYAALGEVPGPIGSRHPSITPFQCFQAADGYIVIAAGNDDLFRRLGDALGAPELVANPKFASNADRTRNHVLLTAEIEGRLVHHGVGLWLDRLIEAGVPCSPINTIDQTLNDPQVRARNMISYSEDPVIGRLMMAGNPIKMTGLADPIDRRAAPSLDSSRVAILRELAGSIDLGAEA
jgi:CoA:oxalate CoA-transferase